MKREILTFTLTLLVFPFLHGTEFALMRDGKAVSAIVISKNASEIEKFAAAELSFYLGKISGGETPAIVTGVMDTMYPVSFVLSSDKRIKGDGFILDVSPKGLRIIAGKEQGFLYGVYEVLKKYGGIRWLLPGADGEYFKVKPTINITAGEQVVNPTFSYRDIAFTCASDISPKWDTLDWMRRNGLQLLDKMNDYKPLTEGLKKRGSENKHGGHCFTDLLIGRELGMSWPVFNRKLEELYKSNPEYFPLINGKRTFLEGHLYQPCTSNPDVIRIMGKNLEQVAAKRVGKGGCYILMNNDGTGWCQCEKCRALDSDFDRKTGSVTSRYWKFVNAMTKETLDKHPEVTLYGFAYQNYQNVPRDVTPDPRLSVQLCYNRICYRHRIDDPSCPTNRDYHNKFQEWAKTGNRIVSREQIPAYTGCDFMPVEEVYLHLLRYYKKYGISGTTCEMAPIDGIYSIKRYADKQFSWYGNWQLLYVHANFQWNIDQDLDKVLEEINSLYYGKGWLGGMKEFHKIQKECFDELPGCYAHGNTASKMLCLKKPGAMQKMLACLDSAEVAAKSDPDPRALRHVQRVRKIFNDSWVKFHKDNSCNMKELCVYRRSGPIKIDGILDEADWKTADVVSNFKILGSKGELAKNQTYIRVVYEPDFIYFAIEAMEGNIKRMKTSVKENYGDVFKDNDLELFISHPDMGFAYHQFLFNSAGVFLYLTGAPGSAPKKNFNVQAEVKTRVIDDRWILEAKIPTDSLGEKCFDGQRWKINALRNRKLVDDWGNETGSEISTLCSGSPNSTLIFMPIIFAKQRSLLNNDSRNVRNGSFNQVVTLNTDPPKWNIMDRKVPKDWILAASGGSLEMLPINENASEYFLKLKSGFIFQYYGAPYWKVDKGEFELDFRISGHGTVSIMAFNYENQPNLRLKFIRSDVVKTMKIDSDEWQRIKLHYSRKDTKNAIAFVFRTDKGEINFDDFSVPTLE